MNWLEDTVRDYAIEHLITQLRIQRKDIEIELPIKMGSSKSKRADIVVFEPNKPHTVDNIDIIVECKAATGSPDENAIEQLKSYVYATSAEKGYVVRQLRNEPVLRWISLELESNSHKRKFKQGAIFTSGISLGIESKVRHYPETSLPLGIRPNPYQSVGIYNTLPDFSSSQNQLASTDIYISRPLTFKSFGRKVLFLLKVGLLAVMCLALCVAILLAAVWIDMFY